MFEITFELAKLKGVIDRNAIGRLILKVEKIIITCSSLTGQFLAYHEFTKLNTSPSKRTLTPEDSFIC